MFNPSLLFKSKFSLRRSFTVVGLSILFAGTYGTLTAIYFVAKDKQESLNSKLETESASASHLIDDTFESAHSAVRSLLLGVPFILESKPAAFSKLVRDHAEYELPRNPALFDLYFAFAEKPARRIFKSPGMVYVISRNLDYYGTTDFDSPANFRAASDRNPRYQTAPSEIWYSGAVSVSREMFRTPLYFDGTYFKRVMISVTKALRDPATGDILGVGGVDLTADRIGQISSKNVFGKTGGTLLADAAGSPILPFIVRDIPMIGFKYSPGTESRPDFVSTLPGPPPFVCDGSGREMTGTDGKKYVYHARAIREPGFCVVAYQAKSEAYASFYRLIALIFFLGGSATLIAVIFSQILAQYITPGMDRMLTNIDQNREILGESGINFRPVEPEGPIEIARIARHLNLLYERLQSSLSEARDEKSRAELATRTKSRFLSVMSHEIRTPLNAMLGLTDVLLLSPLSSEQVRHLRVLQRSGQTLLRILNDILDFSRLEAGKLHIESHEFDLYDLLYDVESLMRFDAEAKGLRFHIVAPSYDYRLSGDSIRIRQALLNFVGNAIKFTAEGAVEVRVTSIQNDDPALKRFQFEVSDSGIGMTAEQQSGLFSEFAQADASITRRYGGTGLGLSISRHIIELLGGKVSVRSELGKGSTFQFTIPLKVVGQRKSHYRETPTELSTRGLARYATPASSKPQKPDTRVRIPGTRLDEVSPPVQAEATAGTTAILVVDDDEDNHRLIAAYLKFKRDLRAVHVFTAREAIAKIQEEKFALVLMDMQMPEMDGLDAIQEIRNLERDGKIPHFPIVMLSANTFPEDREKSIAAGADEHRPKPLKLDEFREMIKRWIPTV